MKGMYMSPIISRGKSVCYVSIWAIKNRDYYIILCCIYVTRESHIQIDYF